ncbi:MAG: winged helix-turn-helix transcriptional regulator [Candidatus Thorarchaeota archaeon]
MDSIDRRILWVLDENCRASYESLSQDLNISANAVRKRVEKLIHDGVILRFMVVPYNALIDVDFICIIVYTDGEEDQGDLIQLMGNHPVVHHVSPIAAIEGGAYHLLGQYSSNQMLIEFRQFLLGLNNVNQVKQYPLLFQKGQKKNLSNTQLKVLSCLVDNPRKSIADIALCSNLAARTARRILNQVQEEQLIRFTVKWDIDAGENISFWILINWNQKKATYEELIEKMQKDFPNEYWTSFVAATEPIIFGRFVVDKLRMAHSIIGKVKKYDAVDSAQVFVCYSAYDFPWLGETFLQEMISSLEM